MADKQVEYRIQFLNMAYWKDIAKPYKRQSPAVRLANRLARNGDVTRVVKVETTVVVVHFK
jgi:hypothetical protein